MLWTWFLARVNHIRLSADAVSAMGIAVWLLYAADRLLDARSISMSGFHEAATRIHEHEARHYFHHRNAKLFRGGIILASVALSFLVPRLTQQSIHLYLVLGAVLFGYFILIHAKNNAIGRESGKSSRLPKEVAVGIFFSAATFIPTVAREPQLRLALLPGALLFAVLCSLNCLFIYIWEHPVAGEHPAPAASRVHPVTAIALRFLPALTTAAAGIAVVLSVADRQLPWQISAACGLSTALLPMLHRKRHIFAPTPLRAAADLCLLTPVLLLPFVAR